MKISKINIKNYRNFKNFEMNLKSFTTLIGENNAGKSNLLISIGLIFSQELSYLKNRNLELADINFKVIQEFKEQIANPSINKEQINMPEVKIEIEMDEFDEDQDSVVGDWFIDNELRTAKLTYTFAPKSNFNKNEWVDSVRTELSSITENEGESPEELIKRKSKFIDFPIQKYEYLIFGGDNKSQRADYYNLKMLKMEILDALRDSKKELTAGNDYRLLYKILKNRGDGCYSEIKKSLENLTEVIKETEELKKVKSEIESYLNKVSLNQNDIENIIDFELSSLEHTELMKKISLKYGANPINIERNGLGRNNLLYISLFLSHATKTNETEETFFRIFGIEEPESHLHPHLQINLAKNIQNIADSNKIQIIITSHSSHLVNRIDLENTSILYNHEGECKSHYILEGFDDTNLENKKTIRYLQKYLDSTNSQMFFARKLILVEGISEQILIPKFYQIIANQPVEKNGINVINVNGVAFTHFLKIIKNGYFLKTVVFTDSDEGTNSENRASNLKTDFENETIKIQITNENTFEKDIINANKNNQGKLKLLEALKMTRPIKGQEIEREIGDNDIDINLFFNAIEEYKSEFALNLLEVLENSEGFNIPHYIQEGLEFIN